jgi:hypothetical protein
LRDLLAKALYTEESNLIYSAAGKTFFVCSMISGFTSFPSIYGFARVPNEIADAYLEEKIMVKNLSHIIVFSHHHHGWLEMIQ